MAQVLCEGPIEAKLRLCYDGYDVGGVGQMARPQLLEMLQARSPHRLRTLTPAPTLTPTQTLTTNPH
eukprot:2341054-Prymnesium_polylepis.2